MTYTFWDIIRRSQYETTQLECCARYAKNRVHMESNYTRKELDAEFIEKHKKLSDAIRERQSHEKKKELNEQIQWITNQLASDILEPSISILLSTMYSTLSKRKQAFHEESRYIKSMDDFINAVSGIIGS